ncbi:hypothetical protein AB0N99_30830 [Streptomyces sp. NPDC093272]|uniref:hypothetical protein n=1 Tax=Streptomyces sp. NPDC093272 TaxID=3154981 RepID=UPI003430B3E6
MSEPVPDEQELADFFAVLDETQAERAAREAAYREWIGEALPALAEQLTATLPADLRAAGMRFEWEAER